MRLPVLMYHKIAPAAPGAAVQGHFVHPDHFHRQMRVLRKLGFESIRLESLDNLPKKPISLTFDDGYENFYANALPILNATGFHGTVFLVSGRIGGTDDWDAPYGATRQTLMSRDQILDAERQGTEFGSHTIDHADLSKCSPEEIRRQLEGSKADLETLLGHPVCSFCYPYGRKNAEVREAVQQAGYTVACSTERGANDERTDRLALRRANIRSDTWTLSFLMKLLRPVRNDA